MCAQKEDGEQERPRPGVGKVTFLTGEHGLPSGLPAAPLLSPPVLSPARLRAFTAEFSVPSSVVTKLSSFQSDKTTRILLPNHQDTLGPLQARCGIAESKSNSMEFFPFNTNRQGGTGIYTDIYLPPYPSTTRSNPHQLTEQETRSQGTD